MWDSNEIWWSPFHLFLWNFHWHIKVVSPEKPMYIFMLPLYNWVQNSVQWIQEVIRWIKGAREDNYFNFSLIALSSIVVKKSQTGDREGNLLVEHLSSNCEALSSNSNTADKQSQAHKFVLWGRNCVASSKWYRLYLSLLKWEMRIIILFF
jgi:hypothetical protein